MNPERDQGETGLMRRRAGRRVKGDVSGTASGGGEVTVPLSRPSMEGGGKDP